MGKFAWVTLATNDSYSLGALVVANSLKRVSTAHELVVLITPGVSQSMRTKLENVFNLVQEVNVLDSKDAAHLALLSRPELGVTFTKLHCWTLTQYEKCVFLDADTLVLQNCDELFDREEFSAARDVGWPDCFNSGVYVYKPSQDTFGKLVEFAVSTGSFDGGDQGLLNQFFSDWSTKDISKHLPFIYNTTTTAVYSYLPAFKRFGQDVKILHFIGNIKPWLQKFDPQSRSVQTPEGYGHITQYLQLWWNIFCDEVHPKLSDEMSGIAGALAKLTLGASRSPEQEEFENSMRRQCWESGNIDYMGKDSFDNIWRRITQTLETGNKQDYPQAPPQRESTPQADTTTTTTTTSAATTTESSDVRLTLDVSKTEVRFEESSVDEQDETYKKNVIARCNTRDLLRTLSSPGTATEEIITTVLDDGRIIQKKILTFPAREIEIEDFETIEILGPRTTTTTTTTTTKQPGQQQQAIKPAPAAVEPQVEPQLQICPVPTENPNQKPKIQMKEILAPQPGDKVEFDETTNTTTITRQTTTGYEQIIATVTPDGRNRVQTKTFFNPVIIRGDEETEEYEETHTTVEGGKKTTTITTENQEHVIEKKEVQSLESAVHRTDEQINTENVQKNVVTGTTEQDKRSTITTSVVVKPADDSNVKTVTKRIPNGYQEITTTINEDGTTKIETKTFYDAVSTTDETTTKVTNTENVQNNVVTAGTTTDQQDKRSTITTSVVVKPANESNVTTVTKKIPNGYQEITTTVNEDGTTKIETKTFYDAVEEEITEETETTSSPSTKTITTTTTDQKALTNVQNVDSKVTKNTTDETSITNVRNVDSSKRVTEQTGAVATVKTTETVVKEVEAPQTKTEETTKVIQTADGLATQKKVTSTTTTTETTETTKITEGKSAIATQNTTTSGKELKDDTTKKVTTKTTDTKQITDAKKAVDETTTKKNVNTVNTGKETTDDKKITVIKVPATGIKPTPGVTVVTEKTDDGHKVITTTVNEDGTTRIETRTCYDSEEEIEEYEEETEETDPVQTTTTTTTTDKKTKATDKKAIATTNVKNQDTKLATTKTTTSDKTALAKTTDKTAIAKQTTETTAVAKTTTEKTAVAKTTTEKTAVAKTTTEKTAVAKTTETTGATKVTKQTDALQKVDDSKKTTTTAIGAANQTKITSTTTKTTETTKITEGRAALATQNVTTTTGQEDSSKKITTKTTDDSVKKGKTTTTVATGKDTKDTKDKSTTTTTKTGVVAKTKPAAGGEPKVTVVVEKTDTGRKEITTTVNPDGTTKISTQTFYDSEEEEEEYEEIEESEPVTTTTTKTTTDKKVSPKVTIPVKGVASPGIKKTPKTPTVTGATPTSPTSPGLSSVDSKALKASTEIPSTPPAVAAAKKKLAPSVPSSNGAGIPVVSSVKAGSSDPVAPPRKKEVKKVTTPGKVDVKK